MRDRKRAERRPAPTPGQTGNESRGSRFSGPPPVSILEPRSSTGLGARRPGVHDSSDIPGGWARSRALDETQFTETNPNTIANLAFLCTYGFSKANGLSPELPRARSSHLRPVIPACTTEPKLTLNLPAIYCPARYFGEWDGLLFLTHFLDASQPFLALNRMIVEIK